MKKNKATEELKAKYDGQAITELREKAKGLRQQEVRIGCELVEILSYFQLDSNFRKIPEYKKSTFEQFLEGDFQLKMKDFYGMRLSFVRYPDECENIGLAIVKTAIAKCGIDEAAKPLNAITAAQKKRKTPLVHADKLAIIRQYAKPKPVQEKPFVVPRAVLEQQLEKEQVQRVEVVKKLESKDEQIEKLKDALRAKDVVIKAKDERIVALEAENVRLKAELACRPDVGAGLVRRTLKYPPVYAHM